MTLKDRLRGFFRALQGTPEHLDRIVRRLLREFSRRLQPLRRYYIPIDYKFALSIAVVIGGSMGLLGYTILRNQNRLIHDQIQQFGSTSAGQLAASALEPMLSGDDLSLDVLVRTLGEEQGVIGTALYDRFGAPIALLGTVPESSGWVADSTVAGYLEWARAGADGEPQAIVTFQRAIRFEGTLIGKAAVTFSSEEMERALLRSRAAIFTATLVMILFGLALSVVVGRRLSRPIHELMDANRAVGEGDLSYRFTGRRNDEIGRLMNSFNDMADGLLQKNHVEDIFARFVPAPLAKKLIKDLRGVELGGQRTSASVLFADIVGFTSMSEEMEPDEVADMINDYFSHTAKAAACYNGSVDKYIGDAAMLVFGVPDPDPDHCLNAVSAAVLFQRTAEKVSERRAEEGKATAMFRVGVNTGQMLAGNMGSMEHMQFTVVGDSVNLASRLCSMGEPGQIVISKAVYDRPEMSRAIVAKRNKSMKLRGKRIPVMTYVVTNLKLEHRKQLEAYLQEITAEGEGAA